VGLVRAIASVRANVFVSINISRVNIEYIIQLNFTCQLFLPLSVVFLRENYILEHMIDSLLALDTSLLLQARTLIGPEYSTLIQIV
jgi:hypothetical protein